MVCFGLGFFLVCKKWRGKYRQGENSRGKDLTGKRPSGKIPARKMPAGKRHSGEKSAGKRPAEKRPAAKTPSRIDLAPRETDASSVCYTDSDLKCVPGTPAGFTEKF